MSCSCFLNITFAQVDRMFIKMIFIYGTQLTNIFRHGQPRQPIVAQTLF